MEAQPRLGRMLDCLAAGGLVLGWAATPPAFARSRPPAPRPPDDDDLVVFELLKHCLSLTEVISGSKFKHSKEECMQLLQVRIHKLKYLINHLNDIFGRNLLFLNI